MKAALGVLFAVFDVLAMPLFAPSKKGRQHQYYYFSRNPKNGLRGGTVEGLKFN